LPRIDITILGAVVVLLVGATIAIPYCGITPLVIVILAIVTVGFVAHQSTFDNRK
jgi:fatty acid desaturase